MKISSVLLRGKLRVASQFVKAHTSLLALSFVLWKATPQGTLALASTNLEAGVVVDTGLQVDDDFPKDGFCVPAKALGDLLVFQEGALTVSYNPKISKLHIAGDGSKTDLACLPGSEYPLFPNSKILGSKFDHNPIAVDPAQFIPALERVAIVASTDDGRPVLQGCLLEFSPGKLMLTGADGYRLAHDSVAISTEHTNAANVMAKDFLAVARHLSEAECNILVGDGRVILRQPDLELFLGRIEGNFPDYNQVVKGLPGSAYRFVFDKNAMLSALYRVRVVVSDARLVRVLLTDNILLRTLNEDVGEGSEIVDAKEEIQGGELKFALNIDYFIQALKNAPGDTLTGEINGEKNSPLYLTAANSPWYHVIMPMNVDG